MIRAIVERGDLRARNTNDTPEQVGFLCQPSIAVCERNEGVDRAAKLLKLRGDNLKVASQSRTSSGAMAFTLPA